jgi:chromate transporter
MNRMASYPQPSLFELFRSFFRLGLTAFGGPSMVAYIRKLSVDQKGWLDKETFNQGVALCQMIPGATAMQATAFVGLRTRGVPGAAVSFIGFGLPAFLIMIVFAAAYTYAYNIPAMISAFSGLQAIIVVLIANATLTFGRTTLKSWRHFAVAIMAAILFGLNINPVIVILAAAVGGLVLMEPKQPAPGSESSSAQVQSTLRPVLWILCVAALGFLLLFLFQRDWFTLAALFFRIDLFAFGGGFASIPLMYHEVVEVRQWMGGPTFLNGIALGQVTPGPIVITATFIGYLLHGPLGGVLATISIFLPSFTLVVGIAPYFDRLQSSVHFNQIIQGVLCSFVGLLFTVTLRFAWNVHWDIPHILLASAAWIALLFKVDILWVVMAGILFSIVLFMRW